MTAEAADSRRALLLDWLNAALAAVDGRRRVRAALANDPESGPVSLLAVGKAAASMALGAHDALGTRLSRALVVAPDGGIPHALASMPHFDCREAGHPAPDERSLAAGDAALDFAAATPAGSRLLLCVSGGASALLEVPAAGVTLSQLRELHALSETSAMDIEELNARRGRLSRIKAGGLPGLFAGCAVEGLMISDVPRDDPAVVGSGLLGGVNVTLVGSLDDALEAVLRAARQSGIVAIRREPRLAGEAAAAARHVCHELALGPPGLQAWGGETVVRLPATPGRGGRCQHLALESAKHIAGHAEFLVLAAGTDGRDGRSEDAGAIVDGGTIARATGAGFNVDASLAAADSGAVLEATGDLVCTGDTGTNVGDIVLALRLAPVSGHAM
jgi:hydroxypyruvate reductase